jgi:hypothetical protein
MHNILSSNEISDILNDPIVKTNKANLSDAHKVVKFEFPLADDMRTKLENRLSIRLSQTIPMRWVKGDTPPHTDKGEKRFSKTHLIYLTNSVGRLIIDGQSYPIAAGDAHVFSEGLEHCTVNTGTSERLMIGPMSETGFGVGFAGIYYFRTLQDIITSLNINPPVGLIGMSGYQLEPVSGITSWIIYENFHPVTPATPSPPGGPYNAGTTLVPTGLYAVYPYVAPPPPPPRPLAWGSMFTNNAQVYYKSHSLSTGSGGSGVRNVRHKQRKT